MVNLAHMMKTTVSIAKRASVSAGGDPSFSAVTTISAMVEATNKVIAFESGEEKVAAYKLATYTPISDSDRVWLPGENPVSVQPHRVISVTNATSTIDGVTLYEVFL